MSLKIKIIILAICSAGSFLAGQHVANKVKQIEIIEVEKILQRERTVTRIVERPDGTKETVIDNRVETETDRSSTNKVTKQSDWAVSVMYAPAVFKQEQEYGLAVTRRVLGNLFAGVYGRSDSEFGLSLRYEF